MKKVKFTERIKLLKGTMELIRTDRIYPVVLRNNPITINTEMKKITNNIHNTYKKKCRNRVFPKH